MNPWTEVFLGVIAFATLAIALVHIAVLVAAGMLARRLGRLVDRLERELKPIVSHLNAIARDTARAAALASTRVERADKLFADLVQKIEQALTSIQSALVAPAREGRALLSAFRAALRVICDLRGPARARRSGAEDEDALFI